MDEQLKAIIDRAVEAGLSDEDIAGLVEEHKARQASSTTPAAPAAPKTAYTDAEWAAMPTGEKMRNALRWAGNAVGGAFMGPAGPQMVKDAEEHPVMTAATMALPGALGGAMKYGGPAVRAGAGAVADVLENPAVNSGIGALEGYRRGGLPGALTGALTGAAGTAIFKGARRIAGLGATPEPTPTPKLPKEQQPRLTDPRLQQTIEQELAARIDGISRPQPAHAPNEPVEAATAARLADAAESPARAGATTDFMRPSATPSPNAGGRLIGKAPTLEGTLQSELEAAMKTRADRVQTPGADPKPRGDGRTVPANRHLVRQQPDRFKKPTPKAKTVDPLAAKMAGPTEVAAAPTPVASHTMAARPNPSPGMTGNMNPADAENAMKALMANAKGTMDPAVLTDTLNDLAHTAYDDPSLEALIRQQLLERLGAAEPPVPAPVSGSIREQLEATLRQRAGK